MLQQQSEQTVIVWVAGVTDSCTFPGLYTKCRSCRPVL